MKRIGLDHPLLAPAGAIALLVVGFFVTVGLPILSGDLNTVTQHTAAETEASLRGRAVYQDEGCVWCHTQQVRAVSNDLGLGVVTRPDRIVRDDPALTGWTRVGPDLACYGDRALKGEDLLAFLEEPSSRFSGSRMPGYGHLSGAELDDLATYLLSLTCGGAK